MKSAHASAYLIFFSVLFFAFEFFFKKNQLFLFNLSVVLFEDVLPKIVWKISVFFYCCLLLRFVKEKIYLISFFIFCFRTIYLAPVNVSSYSVFFPFFIYFFLKTKKLFILTLYIFFFIHLFVKIRFGLSLQSYA